MSGSNSSGRAVRAAEADTPMVAAVHGLPAPEHADAAARRVGRLRMLLVLAVCALPVVGSYVAYYLLPPSGRTNYATLVEPQRPLPAALAFTDLQGRAVDAAALLDGQWTLVVVGGGACDARCEQHLWLVRQLREAMGRDRDRVAKLWIVDDGAAPRAELLATIAAGTPTSVLRADRAALAQWLAPEPGHALADHLYVVDPMRHWMMRTPAGVDASRFKRDLERLLRASASWQPNRR